MSETNAQEPTMEEILASIRRIISEDEAPANAGEPASVAAPKSPPAPPPGFDHDDVLELTERVEPPKAAEPPPAPPAPPRAPPTPPKDALSLGDIDFSAPEPPPPAADPEPRSKADDESLIAPFAATEAALHFGQLAQTLSMPATGRSLEDVVRELLRPLLKAWLEQHLARIVEARVQAEVERISRIRGF